MRLTLRYLPPSAVPMFEDLLGVMDVAGKLETAGQPAAVWIHLIDLPDALSPKCSSAGVIMCARVSGKVALKGFGTSGKPRGANWIIKGQSSTSLANIDH